jgi:hypothetical protein
MHGSAKIMVGVAAVATIAMVGIPGASAARTTKASASARTRAVGTSYFAPTMAGGGVTIFVSRDRRQVRRTTFAYQQTCTDGTTDYNWDGNQAIPLSAAGKFNTSYDSGPRTDPKFPGETTQLVTAMSGAVNKAGTRIVGTTQVTFTDTTPAGTVKCDTGLVHFTAVD